MKYREKSFSVPIDGGENYEKIFGHSGPKKESNPAPKIVDKQGHELTLSSPQKNSLYKQAKRLKAEIAEGLCSHTECDIPNDRNVRKMLRSEFKLSPKIEYFKKCMKAINAEKKDYDVEKLRRR